MALLGLVAAVGNEPSSLDYLFNADLIQWIRANPKILFDGATLLGLPGIFSYFDGIHRWALSKMKRLDVVSADEHLQRLDRAIDLFRSRDAIGNGASLISVDSEIVATPKSALEDTITKRLTHVEAYHYLRETVPLRCETLLRPWRS